MNRVALFLALIFLSIQAHAEKKRDLKILVLIIASDQIPLFQEFQKTWRAYMHEDPEHVEAYFIKGDPTLDSSYAIRGDTIWTRTEEGYVPESAGILNKTILSMKALLPRIRKFDYVLRANLSSFFVFPRLLKFLQKLPPIRCYSGSGTGEDSVVASGSGFILSPDLVELLVAHRKKFLNNATMPDDVLIGFFLRDRRIKLRTFPRLDILAMDDWLLLRDHMPSDVFHFRARVTDRSSHIFAEDIAIHSDLLHMFYNKSL